ncbi:diaminopimelate decarboxylase [Clostridia bacterium]|nr:diaminopimelate decarboxylase [Clostridia bacterium]
MNRQDSYEFDGDGGYNSKKHLLTAGCDAVELAAMYGTPLIVLEEQAIRQRCRAFVRGLKDVGLGGGAWYVAEVNPTQTVLRVVRQEGMGLAAASLAHVSAGMHAGFAPESILLYGPKPGDTLKCAVGLGVGRVSIDSAEEIEPLQAAAQAADIRQDVLLRINPGLNVPLHARDSLWGCAPGARFGIPLDEGEALGAVKRVAACPNLRLIGLHAHLGSQIESEQPYIAALEQLTDFVVLTMVVIGCEMQELNLGGGFPIRFARDDDPPPVAETLASFAYALRAMCQRKGMRLPLLSLTPGRAIVQESGTLLTTVAAVKRYEGLRPCAVTDAVAPDSSNTAFARRQPMLTLANRVGDDFEPIAIADRTSSPSGFLAWDVTLPALRAGDLLACAAMGRAPWPANCAMAIAQYGHAALINHHHEDDGYLSLEKVPARLNH